MPFTIYSPLASPTRPKPSALLTSKRKFFAVRSFSYFIQYALTAPQHNRTYSLHGKTYLQNKTCESDADTAQQLRLITHLTVGTEVSQDCSCGFLSWQQSPVKSCIATSYWLSQWQRWFSKVSSLWRCWKICTQNISTKRSFESWPTHCPVGHGNHTNLQAHVLFAPSFVLLHERPISTHPC